MDKSGMLYNCGIKKDSQGIDGDDLEWIKNYLRAEGEDFEESAISEYETYINEYMEDAYLEMEEYLKEAKEGVYKDNYYLRDHLQTIFVSPVLEKSKNRDAIIDFVAKFMDDHYTQLETAGPVHFFKFDDKDMQPIFELFHVNMDLLHSMYLSTIDETYNGKISAPIDGLIKHAPHKLLIVSMIIESLQKGYDDIIECCEFMFAFTEYPVLYRKFWQLGVKEDLMTFTIEHLSNKHVVRNVKNLKELLKYDATIAVTNMSDKLKTGLDNVYIDFIYGMRNRMKNKFRNISREYYKNNEMNLTQHTNQSEFDDGSLVDQEGYTTNMTQAIDNTIIKFDTGSVNNAIARVVTEKGKLDKDILIGYINQILNAKNNRVHKFIEDVITAYFSRNPADTSVGSTEFLNYGLSLYRSIGTSKDELYAEIRSILLFWVDNIIEIRKAYSSEGTIINYTRAIFDYMIFMINHYN